MIPEHAVLAALERKDFDVTGRRTDAVRMARLGDDRRDHLRLDLQPLTWWRRVLRRPRQVVDLVAGVVWPIGEQAFSRPVPTDPLVPQQSHAATGFAALCRDGGDAATLAAAVDDWCRRLESPDLALDLGAIREPVRRLEFAVVVGRRQVGREAAEQARQAAANLPPARRTKELERIALAEARLPKA